MSRLIDGGIDTPRTDNAEVDQSDFSDWGIGPSGYVYADFARQLERDLAAVTAELANIKNLQRIGNQILDAESGG